MKWRKQYRTYGGDYLLEHPSKGVWRLYYHGEQVGEYATRKKAKKAAEAHRELKVIK